jgi:outer membrane scaffolding protein for murein synthesis (MipA/OmpV family)
MSGVLSLKASRSSSLWCMQASGRLRQADDIGEMLRLMNMDKKQKVGNFARMQFVSGWCLLFGFLLSSPAAAYHLPKWEFGLGAGLLNVPAYRGAKDRKNIWLPVPYIAYRGDRIKVDEEGMRGELMRTNGLRLDFSVAGSLPVSDGDGARKDMPELDPIGEIGPSLEWLIAAKGHRHTEWEQQWWLRFPLRAALSVGDPLIGHRGWVFSPYADWVWVNGTSNARWRLSLSAGPIFASQEYHDYFYTVSSRYATAGRPAYEATAGYSGSRVTMSFSMNSKKWFVGAFARYDDLHGAAFEDSPLVETRDYFAVGVAVSRIFLKSSEKAPHANP